MSAHQQPEVPEVRRNGAEHLYYGCEQDDILQVPKTRTQSQQITRQILRISVLTEQLSVLFDEDDAINSALL